MPPLPRGVDVFHVAVGVVDVVLGTERGDDFGGDVLDKDDLVGLRYNRSLMFPVGGVGTIDTNDAVVTPAGVVVSTVSDNPRDILLRAHKLFLGVVMALVAVVVDEEVDRGVLPRLVFEGVIVTFDGGVVRIPRVGFLLYGLDIGWWWLLGSDGVVVVEVVVVVVACPAAAALLPAVLLFFMVVLDCSDVKCVLGVSSKKLKG